MTWKEQIDKAVASIMEATESERAREIAAKAKHTASALVDRIKSGAVDAAEAFLEANRNPSSLEVHFLSTPI